MDNENNLNEKTIGVTNNSGTPNPSVMPNNNGAPNPSVMPNNNGAPNPSVMPNNNGIPNPSVIPNNNGVPNPSVIPNSNTNTEDDELLKVFIGNNYEKIIKNQFNFPTFFLGSIYLVYRKMYLYGFIIFILNLIISNAIESKMIAYPTSLALSILTGIFIDKIYIKFAKRKIEKIKNKNTGKSFEDIKIICAQKGRTSVASAILFVVLVVGLIFIISFFAIFSLLNIIDNSENDVAESSAYSYVEAVELSLMTYSMENTNPYGINDMSGTCSANGKQLNCSNIPVSLKVDVKGEIPTSGEITINKYGEVEKIENLVIGDHTCSYKNNRVTCEQ